MKTILHIADRAAAMIRFTSALSAVALVIFSVLTAS